MIKKYLSLPLSLFIGLCLSAPLRANNILEQNAEKKIMRQTEEQVIKGCEPFNHTGTNGQTVLLLHGLGGCPYEVRSLGEYLNKQGYTVIGIRYPGHGAMGKVMSNYSWEDWYKSAETEYLNLIQANKDVYVAGFSTGGTISLRLAEKYPLQKVVLLSPFIYLTHKWYYGFTPEMYLNSIGKLITDLPSVLTLVHLNDPVARSKYVRGDYFSLKATRSALELIEIVKKDISLVKSPILLMHSKGDETTDYSSSEFILKNISSDSKKLVTLNKSNHLITLDYEKDQVFSEVKEFLGDENLLKN